MSADIIYAALTGALGYSALVEPALLAHRRIVLRLRELPSGWDGATIHFLSDHHCNRWTSMEERIARILTEPADMLLFGGDIVHRNEAVRHIARLLSGAKLTYRAYGVIGNAERKGWVDTERVMRDLEAAGVTMLHNRSTVLERSGSPLVLAGVDDPYRGQPDIDQALSGAPEGFRLLLAHAPQILRHREVSQVDLVLSGHTHGGQVRIPLVGALMAHSLFERRWAAGLFPPERIRKAFGYERAPTMFVSKGIATGIAHFRFCCLPEVCTFTLASA